MANTESAPIEQVGRGISVKRIPQALKKLPVAVR